MAEAREYTIKNWSPWEDRDNDGAPVRDQHGNYRGSVLFDEDSSEPIDATFKTQPAVGDKKYGVVDLYQTRAGKTRKGFKSAPRPQPGYGNAPVQAGQVAAKREWQPDSPEKQDSIARSVALKAAVDTPWGSPPSETEVLQLADRYLGWLQGIPLQLNPASGYEKARQTAEQLRERTEPVMMPFEGSEYPIDEVPPEYR